jgi:hypothetical protein
LDGGADVGLRFEQELEGDEPLSWSVYLGARYLGLIVNFGRDRGLFATTRGGVHSAEGFRSLRAAGEFLASCR